MTRSVVGYALVFAIPVGVGVAIAVLRTAQRPGLATLSGVVTAVLLFGFVYVLGTTGSPAIEADGAE